METMPGDSIIKTNLTSPVLEVMIMKNVQIQKRRMAAKMCACVDDDHSFLHMEFTIPGVKKKDIRLMLHKDSYNLKAEKDDVEYVSTGRFTCPVEIKSTEAHYKDDQLYIDIPLKDPWKDAYAVQIH